MCRRHITFNMSYAATIKSKCKATKARFIYESMIAEMMSRDVQDIFSLTSTCIVDMELLELVEDMMFLHGQWCRRISLGLEIGMGPDPNKGLSRMDLLQKIISDINTCADRGVLLSLTEYPKMCGLPVVLQVQANLMNLGFKQLSIKEACDHRYLISVNLTD